MYELWVLLSMRDTGSGSSGRSFSPHYCPKIAENSALERKPYVTSACGLVLICPRPITLLASSALKVISNLVCKGCYLQGVGSMRISD